MTDNLAAHKIRSVSGMLLPFVLRWQPLELTVYSVLLAGFVPSVRFSTLVSKVIGY